jgi:transforming growth factor-beta-induced protein
MKLATVIGIGACVLGAGSILAASVGAGRANAQADGTAASQRSILETAAAAGSFKSLAEAIKTAGLDGALAGDGPFTVFAPTDRAFEALGEDRVRRLFRAENRERLTDILKFHVVPGRLELADLLGKREVITLDGQRLQLSESDGRVRIGHAGVVTADIACSNGVIHVIDGVLLPARDSIAETAKSAGSFGTLLAAARAAGLTDALASPGPLTVFAPTDEAFDRLPAGTVESLLRPENTDRLAAILKYHVIPARVYAGEALRAKSAATLEGSSVRIGYSDGRLRVNGVAVVKPDLDASNGVIHVIDRVLIPGTGAEAATPMAAGVAPTSPGEVIRGAIARGVPLFNEGNPGACAAVYETAAGGVIASRDPRVTDAVRSGLERAVRDAAAERDAAERAWILRRGLDAALVELDRAG